MTFIPNDDDRLWKDSQHDGWFRFGNPLKYILFVIILIALVIGIWYLLSPARRNYQAADLALIRADDNPYKVKAKDQGIPHINHQDKLVYGRIRNDQNAPVVEHILPDPEPLLAEFNEDTSSLKMVEQYTPHDNELEKSVESSAETPSLQSISDLIEDLPQEKPLREEKPRALKNNHKGHILIQLGSLKSHDLAEAEWVRISNKHKDILEGLEPVIQKVDLGAEKGIHYRLRTGYFENADDAKAACTALKERKVECLVIL